uniref:Rubicon Homology domain-containing protein n=1 Tax=Romanomermis culicivorax TaxID=13658 RepID=A0A915HLB8_ROMCU
MPKNYHEDCSEYFCYHCVKNTLNDILIEVERMCNDSDVIRLRNLRPDFGNVVVPSSSSTTKHRRSRSDEIFARNFNFNIKNDHSNKSFSTKSSCTGGDNNFAQENEHILKSILETKALKSLILARQYEENAIELEKENAHFILSEILIGAIEQMKWRNVLSSQLYNTRNTAIFGSSTSNMRNSEFFERVTSPTNELTPPSSFDPSESQQSTSSASVDDVIDMETAKYSKPLLGTDDSAEAVATELLELFSKKYISPALTNLRLPDDYLVSFEDAPQSLLPMPSGVIISAEDTFDGNPESKLRGTSDWAPPRQQVIFNIHKPQKLKSLLVSQKNRCPGCGRYVELKYYKRLRYCAYFGKAFCQCCHEGGYFSIPAQIVHKWEFKVQPVSNVALNFLQQSYDLPLYDVYVLNINLYRKVKTLRQSLQLRLKLGFARDFIRTCSLAEKIITKDGINMGQDLGIAVVKDPND